MLIQLENFGPIRTFQFDSSKEMHLIFGANNIGKSYSISAVYLLLKTFLQLKPNLINRYNPFFEFDDKNTLAFYQALKEKIKNNKSSTIDANDECSELANKFFRRLLMPDINKSFSSSFNSIDSLSNRYSKEDLSMAVKFNIMEFIIGVNKSHSDLILASSKLNLNITIAKANTRRKPKFYNNKTCLKFYYNAKTDEISYIERFIEILFLGIIEELRLDVQNIYFLPASRSGLYNALSAFGAIIAELSQNRSFLRSRIELPSISEPLSDYFLNLSSIRVVPKLDHLGEFAKDIENEILDGKVVFNSKTKKLSYRPNNLEDIELDLSFTSSMISEIAPIVAHLKYIIREYGGRLGANDKNLQQNLLFIEEPEAHLHPRIQVKLIRSFITLSKFGLKVVLTSHSNYIFNAVSNQVISKDIIPQKISVNLMQMGEKGSYIKGDAMKVDEAGIDDDNFSDIAEELYLERVKLIENLNLLNNAD